jgi:hypothetical protein
LGIGGAPSDFVFMVIVRAIAGASQQARRLPSKPAAPTPHHEP